MDQPVHAANDTLGRSVERLFSMGTLAPAAIGDWVDGSLASFAVLSPADRASAVESIRTVLRLVVCRGGHVGICEVRVSTGEGQVSVCLLYRPDPTSDEGGTRMELFRRVGVDLAGEAQDPESLLAGT